MKAVLQPEAFVTDYLQPIWEWFADMFFDFQEIFSVNRIAQYIFYLIWIEAIILPFVFCIPFAAFCKDKKIISQPLPAGKG